MTELTTIDAYNNRIQEVTDEIARMRGRQDAIEDAISAKWHGKHASLEAEYAGLTARIAAGEKLIISLNRDRDALAHSQRKDTAAAAYTKQLEKTEATLTELNQLDGEIAKTHAALKEMIERYKHLERVHQADVRHLQTTIDQCQKEGAETDAGRQGRAIRGITGQSRDIVRPRQQMQQVRVING